MTSIDTNTDIGAERPKALLAGLFAALRRNAEKARRNRVTVRDIAEVRAMSDELLRDIGLTRADIEVTVRNGRLPDR